MRHHRHILSWGTPALAVAGGLAGILTPALPASPSSSTPTPPPPDSLVLTGLVHDLHASHPDFEVMPSTGYGLFCGNLAPQLGTNNQPQYTGTGWRISTANNQWKDSAGNPICWHVAETWPAVGDVIGIKAANDNGAIHSANDFKHWFSDKPGVSTSMPLAITMIRQPDGSYLFDHTDDPDYSALGGFFPLEDRLYGNTPSSSPNRNFHFTYELHASFVHDAASGGFFRYTGNQTVWVFVNGQLVIDLGGVGNDITTQYIDLSRLGLADGQIYSFDLFYAQRHTPEAEVRLETTLILTGLPINTVSVVYD